MHHSFAYVDNYLYYETHCWFMAKRNKKEYDLDFTNFNHMLVLLSKQVGKENIEKMVKGELKGVLEQCIANTKSSNKSKIGKRFVLKGSVQKMKDAEKPHNGITYPKQSPDLVSQITFEGNRKFKLPTDLTSENFARVKKRLKGMKERRIGRIGLAKSTFLFIAKKAGIKVKGDKKAESAFKTNPDYGAKVTRVEEKGSGSKYTLTFESTSETVYYGTGGKRVVQRAIDGREKFFKKNLRLGVFDDPEKMAKAYGFIFEG